MRGRVWWAQVLCVCLVVLGGAGEAGAAAGVSCTSGKKGLAAKVRAGIVEALEGRRGTVAVVVHDRGSRTWCALRSAYAFDAASVVKVTVLGALLWDTQRDERGLTEREKELAASMITRSGNSATNVLWNQLGVQKVRGFLKAAKMTQTEPNPYGYWGLTQITARDQQRLTGLLVQENDVLDAASRSYMLELMGKVVKSQRWGVSKGAPGSVRVHIKNGWLQRASLGWRVHSSGVFVGGGQTYSITVFTHGNASMKYGVATIERVARAVHAVLGGPG
ncbi:serine hydrolase [Streptomyces acidiscabies]|uniref:serine hydrolase n=1 Tax=Streptomyces acidiscabies TaxID=42234 RepID=UPI0038D37696